MQITNHIVQSKEWAEFKKAYGTKTIPCGETVYSKHAIPFSGNYIAYCPKVNPFLIDWEKLKRSLKDENCISINFDVPNVAVGTDKASEAVDLFQKHCKKSPRNVFAPNTIFLDTSGTEKDILAKMHPKHRYNIKIALNRGVTTKIAQNEEDYDVFYNMLSDTAVREKYYIHPRNYYHKIWTMLKPKGMCEILIAEHEGMAMGSWMFMFYRNVMYYPYGASADAKNRNYYNPGNLIGWEGIKIGKERGCDLFDMWGAAKNVEDQSDPWWGFTNFKLKFGGVHVTFIPSYDLVVNESMYKMFNLANDLRWKILRLIR